MRTCKPASGELRLEKRLDWITTLIPFCAIVSLCFLFMVFPDDSTSILEAIRFFLGDQLGSYYLIMGLGAFLCSLYMAFSKYGKIRLGRNEKPQYTSFQWGSMMFTAGLAADILFYSLCEWILYAEEPRIADMGAMQDWAATYPLFHWGPIPWSFYMILAVCFGFMIHVRKRSKQKYSEACRALLGKRVDGIWGKLIDLTAVFALLAGTATTFSLATPLLSSALSRVLGIAESNLLTIAILVVICVVYTLAVYFGMEGVAKLAASCVYLFFALLAYFFFWGGEKRFIIETGITSIGNLAQNFISMSTWTDSLRSSSFPQNWTIFYWAYWMVWCVATPFFIGTISKGRTIRQTVLGGYFFGLAGTFTSFIILGNYGLGLQAHGKLDLLGFYSQTGNLYQTILAVFETMPLAKAGLALLAVTMIAFYATSFDALTIVASSYSYKALEADREPDKGVKLFWAVMLMLLPIALIFSENSMTNLQTVSIIAAFPIGFIIFLIVWSFFKDARHYLDHEEIESNHG
ncbi:MAG: BCCT family transporter [Clostridiaceae bacterium]|uniref:BCCT family transporter n=1 Tax=Clostridium porci TaxID=2605778 RepID=A0A7X2TBE9_9CLOT|nr:MULTISPECIES: BCCT family transporter [Clostridium]MCI6139199.1 BCCT family transporter [Clostridium sp.]MDY3231975.1 BCCT family transporter [Clostridiaceae bacterium]MSS35829.1 BCCT family transporter [Clostridium porci]